MFRLLRIFAESPVVTINNTERLSVINQYGGKRVLEYVFWESLVLFQLSFLIFAIGKKIFELNDLKHALLYSCYFFARTRAVLAIFRLFSVKPRESEVSWFDATVKAMDIT